MPGIIVFRRRWSIGSDDLVVPAVLLVALHTVWIIVLAVILGLAHFEVERQCTVDLRDHILGYLVILSGCVVLETIIAWVSLRGSILTVEPRSSMQYLLYIRLVAFLTEVVWLVIGVVWLAQHYSDCSPENAKKAILGVIVCNWCVLVVIVISLWCTFDTAGKKWLKMKRYQDSMKDKERRHGKRSGSGRRNWRQSFVFKKSSLSQQAEPFIMDDHEVKHQNLERKAFRAYEESWDRRFRLMCCCVERKGRNRSSMSEIAQIFTDFFRDLDVVPSDIIAGMFLLRRYQKIRMKFTVSQGSNDVYQYLSGIPITPRTQFLQLSKPEVMSEYRRVVYYMRYALAAYGWPVFMMMHSGTAVCRLLPYLRCCCTSSCKRKLQSEAVVIEDNCCQCNFAAMRKISGLNDLDIVYATYHVDIGETPFFVALDHKYKRVVVCVRGTLSLQDVLTDLKAEAETLPLDPVKEDWLAHRGIVQAATYIKEKMKTDMILSQAFEKDLVKGSQKYDLVLVGHSLGAGTAAVLAILLQQEYPNLHCYAYSPPGGLLSEACMEGTKSFITSIVVGKDVVPRIGLSQMEVLRTDLINVIKKSRYPKWKTISKSVFCCCLDNEPTDRDLQEMNQSDDRNVTAHPSDDRIGLTAHTPLYPPGKIILVVRSHPRTTGRSWRSVEPVYQAVWADNNHFDEVLFSPTMVNDHLPDNVMEALEKVLVNVGPTKPNRTLTEEERMQGLLAYDSGSSSIASTSPKKMYLETSFTSKNPGGSSPIHTCNPQPVSNTDWNNAADESILTLERLQQMNRPLPTRLKPPCYGDYEPDWQGNAPLASPDTLSEVSVPPMSSRSNSFRDSYQRFIHEFPRMEPITHSPLTSKVKKDTSNHKDTQERPANGANGVRTGKLSSAPTMLTATAVVEKSPQISLPNGNRRSKEISPPITKSNNSKMARQNIDFTKRPPKIVAKEPKRLSLDEDILDKDPQMIKVNNVLFPGGCYSQNNATGKSDKDHLIKHSESESYIDQWAAAHVMQRSTEQMDLAHLVDNAEVFEDTLTSGAKRGRLGPVRETLRETPQTSTHTSFADDAERKLSSPRSITDDVFDFPLEETDV